MSDIKIKAKPAPPKPTNPTPEKKPPSVMILVPCMETVHAEFSQSLVMATACMVSAGIQVRCAYSIGSVITIARKNLTDLFMKSDADFAWWVDSDMKFPYDAPIKLLQRQKALVGCNYRRRRFPSPSFTGMMGEVPNFRELQTTDDSPPMEKVDVIPYGMVMVHRSVYEKIPAPHYIQQFDEKHNVEIGEDIYFCKKARDHGVDIWCDHELSKQISHIGVFHFNYNLSVPQ